MNQQFTLWSTGEPPAAPRIWTDLDKVKRTQLITSLARLIRSATRPPNRSPRKEDHHER